MSQAPGSHLGPYQIVRRPPVLHQGSVGFIPPRFSYTFAAAGTYEYYCSIHPTMVGKVIVK
jgi:plastocyanin